MHTITQRELRNGSAAVMDAVERGETFRITRHGVEIAELRPAPRRAFAPVGDVKRALGTLPTGDHKVLRAQADEAFGEDRIGG